MGMLWEIICAAGVESYGEDGVEGEQARLGSATVSTTIRVGSARSPTSNHAEPPGQRRRNVAASILFRVPVTG